MCDTVDRVQFWRSGYKLSMGGALVPIWFGPADFFCCAKMSWLCMEFIIMSSQMVAQW